VGIGEPIGSVGIVWRGAPDAPVPPWREHRLGRIAEEMASRGLSVEPLVFAEETADQFEDTVLSLDAVLVWVDPVVRGRDRSVLDRILRDAAASGVFVSAHPDAILKMGTKEVLARTREMEWAGDCRLIGSITELRTQLPGLLATGPWVLKQCRGSQGAGVWKVEAVTGRAEPTPLVVRVVQALRASTVEEMRVDEFVSRCESYFAAGGPMIAQPYEGRAVEGMIRCYLSRDRVVGFGHQFVTALLPPPPGTLESPAPPPRYYFGPDKPEFQALKALLEEGWVSEMQHLCNVPTAELPLIWDADFLLGARTSAGEDTYRLCEINISGVFPIPDEALRPLADAALDEVLSGKARRRSGE
jgi:hypothetical protein